MSILSGFERVKKYVKTSDGHKLLSHWTSSDTVEMSDGKTLTETNTSIAEEIKKIPKQYIINGEQTQISTENGGTNIFTFENADGTISDFTIKNGIGNRFFTGNIITGTSTTAKIFNTGIKYAMTDDCYINTDTNGSSNGNIYRCTISGDESTAKWKYEGNIGTNIDVVTSSSNGLMISEDKVKLDRFKLIDDELMIVDNNLSIDHIYNFSHRTNSYIGGLCFFEATGFNPPYFSLGDKIRIKFDSSITNQNGSNICLCATNGYTNVPDTYIAVTSGITDTDNITSDKEYIITITACDSTTGYATEAKLESCENKVFTQLDISDSTTITKDIKILSAKEKNPNVNGSLASRINSKTNYWRLLQTGSSTTLDTIKEDMSQYREIMICCWYNNTITPSSILPINILTINNNRLAAYANDFNKYVYCTVSSDKKSYSVMATSGCTYYLYAR